MSMASYRRNVSLGVTGQVTDTCYPAALEQISPYNRLNPDTYKKYEKFVRAWDKLKKKNPHAINPTFKDLISEVAWELGEIEFGDIYFDRVNTYREFSTTVRKLLRREYRITVDIHLDEFDKDTDHPVGLIPLSDDAFKLVSTWVPHFLYGQVSLRDIFEYTAFSKEPYRQRYPFNDANITALPPAA